MNAIVHTYVAIDKKIIYGLKSYSIAREPEYAKFKNGSKATYDNSLNKKLHLNFESNSFEDNEDLIFNAKEIILANDIYFFTARIEFEGIEVSDTDDITTIIYDILDMDITQTDNGESDDTDK